MILERVVAFINALLAHLESISNFHNLTTFRLFCFKNPAAFCLRCMIAHKTLFSPSYSCENTAKRCPIFTVKIRQSFTFDALWCTGKVSYLCIWHVLICSYYGKPKLTKASNTLMCVAYMGETNVIS